MLRDRDEAVFRCVHRLDKTRAASLGINKFLRVEQRSEEHPTFPPHPFLPTQAVSANLFVDTVEPSHPNRPDNFLRTRRHFEARFYRRLVEHSSPRQHGTRKCQPAALIISRPW